MNVMVKMFAAARDAVGASEVPVELSGPATIAAVRAALCEAYPQVRPLVERSIFAVDAQYAQDDATIPENAEIACLPPVSGG